METRSSFGKWQVGVNHIWHLLLYIKKSLLVIDNRDPVNQVAADMYVTKYLLTINDRDNEEVSTCNRFTHDMAEFQRRATECILECKEHLNDPNQFSSDPHYLRFSQYNPNIHGTFRKAVIANAKANNLLNAGAGVKSLSWVKAGSLQPCASQD